MVCITTRCICCFQTVFHISALAKAYNRLTMTFKSFDDYLDYWGAENPHIGTGLFLIYFCTLKIVVTMYTHTFSIDIDKVKRNFFTYVNKSHSSMVCF